MLDLTLSAMTFVGVMGIIILLFFIMGSVEKVEDKADEVKRIISNKREFKSTLEKTIMR